MSFASIQDEIPASTQQSAQS